MTGERFAITIFYSGLDFKDWKDRTYKTIERIIDKNLVCEVSYKADEIARNNYDPSGLSFVLDSKEPVRDSRHVHLDDEGTPINVILEHRTNI